jgi:hypothetical protein
MHNSAYNFHPEKMIQSIDEADRFFEEKSSGKRVLDEFYIG